jgi:hypothetical protein
MILMRNVKQVERPKKPSKKSTWNGKIEFNGKEKSRLHHNASSFL